MELVGPAAVANARAAYARFKKIFRGERFAELAVAGARVQRPLWASTGVKNPHYKDTKYVEELVAPDTVNTMPMPTLLAVGDHGETRPGTAEEDPEPALAALRDAGIDMDDVTGKLLRDAGRRFERAMEKRMPG